MCVTIVIKEKGHDECVGTQKELEGGGRRDNDINNVFRYEILKKKKSKIK